MPKVYGTLEEAQKDLIPAKLELSHGGTQEVFIEHYNAGYVIAEFKIIRGEHIFQRYYNGD